MHLSVRFAGFLVSIAMVLSTALGAINPSIVSHNVAQGAPISVETVISLRGAPVSVSKADVCFVQDATGSFSTSCRRMRNSIPAIVDLFASVDAVFGMKTFKDYTDGDAVYQSRLFRGTGKEIKNEYRDFCDGGTFGGGDDKETQYDAIVKAASRGPDGCRWRPGATRFMIAAHDSGCKGPAFGPEYMNTRDSTRQALLDGDITFIGVTRGGDSTNCFQPFADATGGAIEEIGETDDLGNAVSSVLRGVGAQISPTFSPGCSLLSVVFDPPAPWTVRASEAITVRQTLTALAAAPDAISCNVDYAEAGRQRLRLKVRRNPRPVCGNGIQEGDEQCDGSRPVCRADCTCSRGYRFIPRLNKCVSV